MMVFCVTVIREVHHAVHTVYFPTYKLSISGGVFFM